VSDSVRPSEVEVGVGVSVIVLVLSHPMRVSPEMVSSSSGGVTTGSGSSTSGAMNTVWK
jgi:hypothetical protein